MVSGVWVLTSVLLVVALILPYLKKDKTGNARKDDLFFQVPALIVLTVIMSVSFANLGNPVFSFRSSMNIAGALLFTASLVVRLSAHVTINTNYSWTLEIREGHTLVEDGLYRYVRHPIYLGTFIGVMAIPVYTSSLLGFLLSFLAIPVLNYRIGIEERMLIEEFGEEYERYRERTWRLFPYIY